MQLLGMFPRASLCSLKYVMVITLTRKNQTITQVKRPHYPIWAIYPQVWNQCFMLNVVAVCVKRSLCRCSLLQLRTVRRVYTLLAADAKTAHDWIDKIQLRIQ